MKRNSARTHTLRIAIIGCVIVSVILVVGTIWIWRLLNVGVEVKGQMVVF